MGAFQLSFHSFASRRKRKEGINLYMYLGLVLY